MEKAVGKGTGSALPPVSCEKCGEREALEQIKRPAYYEKYLCKEKEVVLMGIGFAPEARNIGNYILESCLPPVKPAKI